MPRHSRSTRIAVAVWLSALLTTAGLQALPANAQQTSSSGASASQALSAIQAQRPGRPRAKVKVSDANPLTEEAITVRTGGSRSPAGLRKLILSFGDNKRITRHSKRVRVDHSYAEPGTYTVKVVVVDRLGRRDSARTKVVVAEPAPTFGALAPTDDFTPEVLPQADGLPATVDLSAWDMDVQNQSPRGTSPGIGSCVSWAIGYAMMGWYNQKVYGTNTTFAPMYLYSQRHRPVTGNTVGGMLAKEAFELLKTEGIDTAAHYGSGWAYDWRTLPGAAQKQAAASNRITGYRPLFANKDLRGADAAGQYAIKAALASGAPVAIAINLKSDFSTYSGGVYHATGSALGLHEMLALGYDDSGLLVQNSWGTAWGQGGYVRIGWDAVAKDLYEAMVIDGLVTATSTSDSVAPTVTVPRNQIRAGTSMNSTGIPVTVSWEGTDNSGAVAGYSLYARTNGGEWSRQSLSSGTATSIVFSLTPGNRYQFAIAAVDPSGNWSQWSIGNEFNVADYDDTSTYVSYTGSWYRTPWEPADFGTLTTSDQAGSTASFTFNGSNVAWVATSASNRGQAWVYLDGDYVTTIDLYSATVKPKYVALHGNWAGNERHTITVEVVGTAGRPTVDVDSFVLLY